MLALLGHAYAASGQKAAAQNVLNDLRDLQDRRYVSPYTIAAIHAATRRKDQAFKWLDKADEERDIWLMNLKVDPVFNCDQIHVPGSADASRFETVNLPTTVRAGTSSAYS